jgi:hypothetical protein
MQEMRSPAPQWRAAELISRRIALHNSIGKAAAHMISEIACGWSSNCLTPEDGILPVVSNEALDSGLWLMT